MLINIQEDSRKPNIIEQKKIFLPYNNQNINDTKQRTKLLTVIWQKCQEIYKCKHRINPVILVEILKVIRAGEDVLQYPRGHRCQ